MKKVGNGLNSYLMNISQFCQVLHATSNTSQKMHQLQLGQTPISICKTRLQVPVQSSVRDLLQTHVDSGSVVGDPVHHQHIRVVELWHGRTFQREHSQVVRVWLVTASNSHDAFLILRMVQNSSAFICSSIRIISVIWAVQFLSWNNKNVKHKTSLYYFNPKIKLNYFE